MSLSLYRDLAWLPAPPSDFRMRCRSLAKNGGGGVEVAWLAGHALGEAQLVQLARAIGQLRAAGADLAPLAPFRLGIVGTGTVDLLVPALVASAARHGILLDCILADYSQIAQEALDPSGQINGAGCDAVLIALDYRSLPIPPRLDARDEAVAASLSFLSMLREGFRSHGRAATILVSTIAPPPESLFGGLDRQIASTLRSITGDINAALARDLAKSPDTLLDVAAIAETVGLAEWYSNEQWNLAKLPFSASYTGLYADHVGRLLGSLRGKARRCLILDLDNTVWGGVVGDDGLEGLRIAEGDATGEAFLNVQRTALQLRERGVVLAVSSKNNDDVARGVFRNHPEMLLRESHITVFQANWNDKASNITAIADELSLGLSSMVFLDDNPAERGLVRELLPEVAVPELPQDPALYARTLLAAGYFEATSFSDEDRKRAEFYDGNAKRAALQHQVGGVEDYLRSLDMTIDFAPFNAAGRDRTSQLINKSNQFNLTTRRYTEAEVGALEADPDIFTMQVRLSDKFGDNGMISVVIARPGGVAEWMIDTWLMSCRVLGRKVEQMVLRQLVLQARKRGIKRLVGTYIPTGRNAMVAEHYAKLGFTAVDTSNGDVTSWELSTAIDINAVPMMVVSAFDSMPTTIR